MFTDSTILEVKGVGMVSPLGYTAEASCAAMRCNYDAFELTEFYSDNKNEKQIGSFVTLDNNSRGMAKLAEMTTMALNEACEMANLDASEAPWIFCLPENSRSYFDKPQSRRLYTLIGKSYQTENRFKDYFCRAGRISFVGALDLARKVLAEQQNVIILALDSYINQADITYLGSNQKNAENSLIQPCRLLNEDYSDAFIPGEAAVAIVLQKGHKNKLATLRNKSKHVQPMQNPLSQSADKYGDKHNGSLFITGIGIENEENYLYSGTPNKAEGMVKAMRGAAEQANMSVRDTDYYMLSASGESYFFEEASNAIFKTIRPKKDSYPNWCPADYLGETGAAVGGIMLAKAWYANQKRYHPVAVGTSNKILCAMSNDDPQRGAFIAEYYA